MKTFDMTRFGNVMKWSLMTEKRQILRNFLGILVGFLLIHMVFVGFHPNTDELQFLYQIQQAAGPTVLIWYLAGGYFTAELFRNLRTKQGRTTFFMLPASNKEKFWSRVALSMFYAIVVSTVALIAADIVQMLLTWLTSGRAMSITYEIITEGDRGIISNFYHLKEAQDTAEWTTGLIASIGISLWLITSYILGGTFFRKVPVVMTTLVWIIILFTIGIISAFTVEYVAEMDKNIEITFLFGFQTTINIVAIIVSCFFTFLNLWLSTRMFNRMGIIEKKWSFTIKKQTSSNAIQ